MSFLPGFQDDVCISYSSIDDEKLTIHKLGWVDHLYINLKARLDKHLAQESAIWRDQVDLAGNAVLKPSLDKAFRSSATLVPVIAPRYFTSDWCQLEYQAFRSAAQSSGGLIVDGKSRIFKVMKQPVENEPPELLEVKPYIFYKIDPVTRKPRDLDPELDRDSQYAYVCKVDDLACDIAKFLKGYKNGTIEGTPRATVYLALTTSDLQDARDSIQRQLESYGFMVLPDEDLRVSDTRFCDKVTRLLAQSAASIHLVGETYGENPKGETRSHSEIQAALSAERCLATPAFRRVIWMPSRAHSDNPQQQKFLDALRTDSTAQKQTSIIEKELGELKDFLLDLFPGEAQLQLPSPAKKRQKIYVILSAEAANSDDIGSLVQCLFEKGFDTEHSLPGKDLLKAQLQHEKRLKSCDAFLIYYGNEDYSWLSERLEECAKFAGRPTAAYFAAPETPAKRLFRSHDVRVIQNYGTFSDALLAEFLDGLNGKRP